MIIGVISDTHIPVACQELPKEIEKYFQGVDLIIHAGDLIELSVLDQLAKFTKNIVAVCGNMDCPQVQNTLPKKKVITAGNYKIGLIHGQGPTKNLPELVRKEFDNIDIVVFGHSHKALNVKKDGVLFFNPGTPTDDIFAEFKSIGILELNEQKKGKIIKI